MSSFEQTLASYKQRIDSVVADECRKMLVETKNEFGEYPAESVRAYCELLSRGGKRIRGVLTMISYFMHGGTDEDVALQAAKAVEMLQAYILITDDIQDQSTMRRGGPSAHILLKNYHEKHNLKFDSLHFGESIAMNSMLFGAHSAINVLADLSVEAGTRLEVIKNVNKYFISTAHGQTLDIFNEAVGSLSEEDVNKVLVWKTAFYTFLSPLQVGAILAGAGKQELTKLEGFALEAGRAYQIADDIIGIFGDDEKTGKSAMDDIREGKRTILSVRALKESSTEDAKFLELMLGNATITQKEFDRCKSIIKDSGALDYAKDESRASAEKAFKELNEIDSELALDQIEFLKQLVESLLQRNS